MIFWNEYKQYKATAERLLVEGSNNTYIQIQVLKFQLKKITREEAIEEIIDILSNREHKKPLVWNANFPQKKK